MGVDFARTVGWIFTLATMGSLATTSLCAEESSGSGTEGAASPANNALVGQFDLSGMSGLEAVDRLARHGHSLESKGELDQAAKLYRQALTQFLDDAGDSIEAEQAASRRIWLSFALLRMDKLQGRSEQAVESLVRLRQDQDLLNEKEQAWLVRDAFAIGKSALRAGLSGAAELAFEIAYDVSEQTEQQAAAQLGQAWAIMKEPDRQRDAVERLTAFIDSYPDHQDAALACRVCAESLKQLGREQDSLQMMSDLLQRWPDSKLAFQWVQVHVNAPFEEVPESVRGWLLRQSENEAGASWDPVTISLATEVALRVQKPSTASALSGSLLKQDRTGQATSSLLDRLSQAGLASDAERIAAMFISPPSDVVAATQAREAACRWAGRAEKWSLLAFAAQNESLELATANRSIGTERLFAESLMQTGQTDKAKAWWDHLVDQRKVQDFATLLRCAEAETAVGRETRVAQERVALAREAAGKDPFSISLVDLLAAEVAIRRSKFHDARRLLENVIRGVGTDPSLRGRAQWLIGETYYIQHKFAEAIDAYRQVEGVDPNGSWIPASLVQAGKAFEQLGRTREAAVCYGSLLGRFADSSHADAARQRMAALAPKDDKPNNRSTRR